MTPKEFRDPNYCSKHPTYKGIRHTTTGCSRCQGIYGLKHFGAYMPTTGKPKLNRICFVIDKSGSMVSLMGRASQALRDNLETVRGQALMTGQRTLVTLISFNSAVNVHFRDMDIDQAIRSLPGFYAMGSTALFDAVGEGISILRRAPTLPDEDVANLLIAITDGEENTSQRFNSCNLNELMREVQATDRWTLTFLVPPNHKRNLCRSFAIPEGNVREWEATEQGINDYRTATDTGLTNYYTSRASGQTAVKSFYTDLSKVTPNQVKRALTDIRDQVQVWSVEREEQVRPFCEKKSYKPFLRGAAFYALTKTEKKVQPNKQILIMEKGKGAVYAGADARHLLGLPDGETVKVVPGNHANWDVYVQSTSTNRPLVRGTKVVYWPAAGKPYKTGKSARR